MANVVEPLFIEWNRFLPSTLTSVQLTNLRLNRSKWDEITAQERLEARTMTVVALTETPPPLQVAPPQPPRTPDRTLHARGVSPSAAAVVDLDALCNDKENANPLLLNTSSSDLISKLANRLGGMNGHRRHSLPTDHISGSEPCPVVSHMGAAAECRRHSLPNCERNGGGGSTNARRLSSLVECSPVGDDHFDFDRNSNVRRASQDTRRRTPNPSSNTRLGLSSSDWGGSNRRCSDVAPTAHLRLPDGSTSANARRASYPLNVLNDAVTRCSNGSARDCSNPEIGCPARIISTSSVLRPPNKKTGNCRKLSLEESHHRAAANSENKRSRSLATSTLLYPVDENLTRMKVDLMSAAAAGDSVCWRAAASGNAAGLVNASYLERCPGEGSTDPINHHYLTMNVLHKTRNTRCQAGTISGERIMQVIVQWRWWSL